MTGSRLRPTLFVGLFLTGLLVATLQGVQGEDELEAVPSEDLCRPYIEKALKDLGTGSLEQTSAEVQGGGDEEERQDTEEVTSIEHGDGIPSDEDEGADQRGIEEGDSDQDEIETIEVTSVESAAEKENEGSVEQSERDKSTQGHDEDATTDGDDEGSQDETKEKGDINDENNRFEGAEISVETEDFEEKVAESDEQSGQVKSEEKVKEVDQESKSAEIEVDIDAKTDASSSKATDNDASGAKTGASGHSFDSEKTHVKVKKVEAASTTGKRLRYGRWTKIEELEDEDSQEMKIADKPKPVEQPNKRRGRYGKWTKFEELGDEEEEEVKSTTKSAATKVEKPEEPVRVGRYGKWTKFEELDDEEEIVSGKESVKDDKEEKSEEPVRVGRYGKWTKFEDLEDEEEVVSSKESVRDDKEEKSEEPVRVGRYGKWTKFEELEDEDEEKRSGESATGKSKEEEQPEEPVRVGRYGKWTIFEELEDEDATSGEKSATEQVAKKDKETDEPVRVGRYGKWTIFEELEDEEEPSTPAPFARREEKEEVIDRKLRPYGRWTIVEELDEIKDIPTESPTVKTEETEPVRTGKYGRWTLPETDEEISKESVEKVKETETVIPKKTAEVIDKKTIGVKYQVEEKMVSKEDEVEEKKVSAAVREKRDVEEKKITEVDSVEEETEKEQEVDEEEDLKVDERDELEKREGGEEEEDQEVEEEGKEEEEKEVEVSDSEEAKVEETEEAVRGKEEVEVEEKEEAGPESEEKVQSHEVESKKSEEKEGKSKEASLEDRSVPTPEEELIQGIEIPENLRSRDHINQLLKLDEENEEKEKAVEKVADIILKDLKRLYDEAIKPLETLYKYRDLSNRHFGDPEIFSKPLVLFMGPWSGGKSSIINYLLDVEYNENSLRTGAEPSPAYFNILMHGERTEVLDGTQLAADWTFSGLQKFGQGMLDRLRGLRLRNKLLDKVNIVEIPGILEIRKQVQRLFPFNDACQWFIDRADIIFLVYDPSKLDVGPETEAILDQLKGREYQTRIILNKADQVKPEELMRVQGALIWNISPLMSSAEPPIMYSTSLWSMPYEAGAPTRLLYAQERAFLRDLRAAINKRVEHKIASARRFAVRVRNHAKMVDCYLTTYYNHKSIFGNKKDISDKIIENPQNYHIYEGLSTLTNISRYDLPDPDVYRDFFRLNPLYEFPLLSSTCTYFRGCPINRLDVAIAYDLPELVGKYKKLAEAALRENDMDGSKS